MRNRKAQLNAAPGETLSGQNAHRPDYWWEEERFYTTLFQKKGAYPPPEIGTNLKADLIILNPDHAIFSDLGPSTGLAKALVRIDSIGIVRGGDRSRWNQRMRQQKLD